MWGRPLEPYKPMECFVYRGSVAGGIRTKPREVKDDRNGVNSPGSGSLAPSTSGDLFLQKPIFDTQFPRSSLSCPPALKECQTPHINSDSRAGKEILATKLQTSFCPLPPIEIMDFGGPIYDTASRTWPISYSVFNDGSIDEIIHAATIRAPGDFNSEASHKTVTLAAGKAYINICHCRRPGRTPPPSFNGILLSHDSDCHETVGFSGFWLEGFKFVTAAHFLSSNPPLSEEEKKDTLDLLKYASPPPSTRAMRARVSSQFSSQDCNHYEHLVGQLHVPQIYDVQLADHNEAADIAVFRLAVHETRRPQVWIKNSQLSSAAANFPGTVPSMVFSTYYPASDYPVNPINNLSPVEKKEQENCTRFELMVKERVRKGKQCGDNSDQVHLPRFEDIFHANCRSIGFGHIAEPSPRDVSHRGAVLRTHSIPGFAGCSGAMIGCLETTHCPTPEGLLVPNLSVKIIGIFKGESGDCMNYNTFSAFTQCGVDSIVNC
ncbi:hypothetical protein FOPE_03365 [Fonsecaea pedrosoi]|nr:hypothetical protein FOPE_03365 [Fonsecaea pedrosoi]